MNVPIREITLITLLIVFSSSAAAENGWFIRGALGSASVAENFDSFILDDFSTAYRLSGGWRFNPNFAVSAGYTNLGKFRQNLSLIGLPINFSASADGFTFAALGTFPIGDVFSFNGQLGAFFWDGNTRINAITADPGDTNLVAGLGISAKLSSNFSLTADFVHYDLDEADANVFYGGFEFHVGKR